MIFDKSLLKKFQHWLKKAGLRQAVAKLLTELGVKEIKVIGNLPKTGPVLIVSNHTGVFDSLLLLSKIKRQDFYLIALVTYKVFQGELARRCIPIYRRVNGIIKFTSIRYVCRLTGNCQKTILLK